MRTVRVPLALLSLVLPWSQVAAQGSVPVTALTRAEPRFAVDFSAVNGVRELPGAAVLVSDGIEEVLLRIDPRSGRVDTLGRTGQGPGEYRSPDALHPLPGGGTLLVDLGNARLNILGPDGAYRESVSIAQGGEGRPIIVIPRAVDQAGRIYFLRRDPNPSADSAAVVRWDRTRGTFETVTHVGLGNTLTRQSGTANNQSIAQRPQPFPAGDAWSVAPDGSVFVARASDYHAEWLRPSGTVRGRPVRVTPVPVRSAEREEWTEEMSTALRISVENRNGETRMGFSRRPEPGGSDSDGLVWPATKPAFPSGGAWVTPEGEAWVERSVPAGAPRIMDVFGPDGALRRQVRLPAGRRVAGFGAGTVYLRHSDPETGLAALERYRR
jgi:hypothetical protein